MNGLKDELETTEQDAKWAELSHCVPVRVTPRFVLALLKGDVTLSDYLPRDAELLNDDVRPIPIGYTDAHGFQSESGFVMFVHSRSLPKINPRENQPYWNPKVTISMDMNDL